MLDKDLRAQLAREYNLDMDALIRNKDSQRTKPSQVEVVRKCEELFNNRVE